MRTSFIILWALLSGGCGLIQQAFPDEPLRYSRDRRASIRVQGAPQDALLYVDGQKMGEADQFDGDPDVLRLDPGTYQFRVVKGDRILLDRKIGLGSAPKKIFVR